MINAVSQGPGSLDFSGSSLVNPFNAILAKGRTSGLLVGWRQCQAMPYKQRRASEAPAPSWNIRFRYLSRTWSRWSWGVWSSSCSPKAATTSPTYCSYTLLVLELTEALCKKFLPAAAATKLALARALLTGSRVTGFTAPGVSKSVHVRLAPLRGAVVELPGRSSVPGSSKQFRACRREVEKGRAFAKTFGAPQATCHQFCNARSKHHEVRKTPNMLRWRGRVEGDSILREKWPIQIFVLIQ